MIIIFLIFDGKQQPKIFGSMDVKITPDFCSFKSKHPGSLQLIFSTFFFSILQKRPGIFKEFLFLFGRLKNIYFFNSVSKINQGSCLSCLGGDDAPEAYLVKSDKA